MGCNHSLLVDRFVSLCGLAFFSRALRCGIMEWHDEQSNRHLYICFNSNNIPFHPSTETNERQALFLE